MELKTYVHIREVDKRHQLKDDYVLVSEDHKTVRIHDPYEGNAGFKRIPEQKKGAEFTFKCDKVVEQAQGGGNVLPIPITLYM